MMGRIERGNSSEKILVTVRMKPLDTARYDDLIAWECPDDHTIIFKNPKPEKYFVDRVFEPTSATQEVYEGGCRDVALSALAGTNATIFAYGHTSSGKTFTMREVTESIVKDIYEHITKTEERSFLLKLSALEIYKENVVDLLNYGTGPLPLLDDPENGTTVESRQHLENLIGICQAQRPAGETALNDKSSRSHQIIRLTIQSRLREIAGCVPPIMATLNLVDLAGSERACQTNADGLRLKEGNHINRSFLTLATVIRNLSSARRSDHVPYRDSKLTRILQNSLGGSARIAIICTISTALSHIEDTKKTLSFAMSAKEVTNRAKVNVVVSEVKHPQRKLDSELIRPFKSLEIQQVETEMKTKRQRDIAQSQLESSSQVSSSSGRFDLERKAKKQRKGSNECEASSSRHSSGRFSVKRSGRSILIRQIRLAVKSQEEAKQAIELIHKEVTCHKLRDQQGVEEVVKKLSEISEMQKSSLLTEEIVVGDLASLKEEITRLNSQEIAGLEKKLESVRKSIDMLLKEKESADLKRTKGMFAATLEDIKTHVVGLQDRMAKIAYQKNLLLDHVVELETAEYDTMVESQADWLLCFEKQRKKIIGLWHLCDISIIRRTKFYLLFKGDQADQFYMEVELRRLTWLKEKKLEMGNPFAKETASIKALKQEREYLAERVNTKLGAEEREMLYLKWDVPTVGKQRSHQFIDKLWTDPDNMEHVRESAEIVAKLVGFGENIRKEMFELNFASPSGSDKKKTWKVWKFITKFFHF